MAKICGLMLLILVGCSAAVESTPEKPVDVQAFIAGVDVQARAITAKQDQAIASIEATRTEIVSQNKQIIDTLKTLEASLSAPKPNGQEVIKSALESPAKANTQQAPLKVATPGTSQESLVELASRLYARGVNVNNRTREELEAIDAQMNGGQPVTGAMFQNNGTSAITSKRSAVRFVPRGSGVVQWQNYSNQSTCGPGGCPPRRSR